jgi:hypothetical protein
MGTGKSVGIGIDQKLNTITFIAGKSMRLHVEGFSPSKERFANHPSINLVSNFRCSSPSSNPVCARCVDPVTLVFSLSSHRQAYIGLLYNSRFIDL